MTLGQRRAVFARCSRAQQVDLYLFHTFSTLPENDDLLDALLVGGASTAPALVERIVKAPPSAEAMGAAIEHERDIGELIFVLSILEGTGKYDLAAHWETFGRVVSAVSAMCFSVLREAALEGLNRMLPTDEALHDPGMPDSDRCREILARWEGASEGPEDAPEQAPPIEIFGIP
jgi:hypothetical protein